MLEQWAILPFTHKKIKGKNLITNRFGNWVFLDDTELQQLKRVEMDESLLIKLQDSQIILTPANAQKVISDFAELNKNLFIGPTLIIVSLTSYCNFGVMS